MNRPATVTVAMPVLDEEEHIGDQLAALARQSYAGPWEVVIADNGCTDHTVEIALGWRDRLPTLRVVDATARRGINRARNVAADAASGDLIAFCDADDVAAPGWLAALAEAAREAPLVGGALESEELNSARVLDWHERPPADTGLPVAHGLLPYVPGGNCAVWADVARELRWDESFTFGNSDIDFSWRAQLAGHRLGYAPGALMHRRFAGTLPGIARRYYHYGRADPHLHRRYARLGMRRPGTVQGRVPAWRLLTEAPRLPRSAVAQGVWARATARGLGRATGERRPRRPARREPADLLEVDVSWPPETFVRWKLEGLAARGLEVTATATADRCDARAELPSVGLERVPRWNEPKVRKAAGLLLGAGRLLRQPRRSLALARAAGGRAGSAAEAAGLVRRYARLSTLSPAVAHFEWESAAIDHLPLIEAWSRPIVVSCHGGLSAWPFAGRAPRRLALLPVLFDRLSVLHCVCEAQREQAVRLGADPGRIRVIRQGVDPGEFAPPPAARAPGETFELVSVGRLVWEKGWEYLIRSMRLLLDGGVDARLQIAGNGPERGRIAAAVADMDLEGQVTLLGSRPSPAVRQLLQDADAFALASVVEGVPIAMLEAMACGLAVVVTDCGGVPEAVTDEVNGLLVPSRDPHAMASALGALAADPERRRRLGRAARERVERDFTLERQLDEFAALYEELARAAA
jgi:glycosyltransferase involved in cell wall biosynthesis